MLESTALKRLSTYNRPCSKAPHRKGSALTSDHARKHRIERALSPRLRIPGNWLGASILLENGISPYIWSSGTHPSITSKWPCTHIWSCRNQSYISIRMAPSPRLSYLVTNQAPPFSQRMVVALTSDLLVRMANTHIWHGRNLIL